MSKSALVRGCRNLAWFGVLVVGGGWAIIGVLGDRAWWALPVLFGPRWPWLLVVAATVPYLLIAPRRGLIPAVTAFLVAGLGIIDWRLGLGRLSPSDGPAIRIMTLNAGDASAIPGSPRILDEIRRVDPDLVVLTECSAALPIALRTMSATYELRVAKETANCLLVRGTITGWEERDPTDAFRQNGSGAIQRVEVQLSQGTIRLGMVHLATPRDALQEFRALSQIPSLGAPTRQNMAEREEESEHAVRWIDTGPGLPLVIAGDFNLPIESAIYRRNWAGYRNAFSAVGWGTGYTKHTRWWGIRIDHILMSSDIHPWRSFVGREVGSDHLPLIADLRLPPQRTSTAR